MFEAAELGHKVEKGTYDRVVPALREALLNAQFDLSTAARFPVIVVIGGVDGAGKGETVNLLNEWMDPRHIHTHALSEPSNEERERPRIWRYWRALPPCAGRRLRAEPPLVVARSAAPGVCTACRRSRNHRSYTGAYRTRTAPAFVHIGNTVSPSRAGA
jgi:Polyphosphate kinase 2 (PPK2)